MPVDIYRIHNLGVLRSTAESLWPPMANVGNAVEKLGYPALKEKFAALEENYNLFLKKLEECAKTEFEVFDKQNREG